MARRREEPQAITLPIAPMLDMTFQLLALFILTFRPAPLEGQIALNLPASPTERSVVPGVPTELAVEVRDAAGGVGGLTLRTADGRVEVPDASPAALERLLRERRAGLPADQKVTIESADGVRVEGVMRVIDACRSAGFAVGFGRAS